MFRQKFAQTWHSASVASDPTVFQDKPLKKETNEKWRPEVTHLPIAGLRIPVIMAYPSG